MKAEPLRKYPCYKVMQPLNTTYNNIYIMNVKHVKYKVNCI